MAPVHPLQSNKKQKTEIVYSSVCKSEIKEIVYENESDDEFSNVSPSVLLPENENGSCNVFSSYLKCLIHFLSKMIYFLAFLLFSIVSIVPNVREAFNNFMNKYSFTKPKKIKIIYNGQNILSTAFRHEYMSTRDQRKIKPSEFGSTQEFMREESTQTAALKYNPNSVTKSTGHYKPILSKLHVKEIGCQTKNYKYFTSTATQTRRQNPLKHMLKDESSQTKREKCVYQNINKSPEIEVNASKRKPLLCKKCILTVTGQNINKQNFTPGRKLLCHRCLLVVRGCYGIKENLSDAESFEDKYVNNISSDMESDTDEVDIRRQKHKKTSGKRHPSQDTYYHVHGPSPAVSENDSQECSYKKRVQFPYMKKRNRGKRFPEIKIKKNKQKILHTTDKERKPKCHCYKPPTSNSDESETLCQRQSSPERYALQLSSQTPKHCCMGRLPRPHPHQTLPVPQTWHFNPYIAPIKEYQVRPEENTLCIKNNFPRTLNDSNRFESPLKAAFHPQAGEYVLSCMPVSPTTKTNNKQQAPPQNVIDRSHQADNTCGPMTQVSRTQNCVAQHIPPSNSAYYAQLTENALVGSTCNQTQNNTGPNIAPCALSHQCQMTEQELNTIPKHPMKINNSNQVLDTFNAAPSSSYVQNQFQSVSSEGEFGKATESPTVQTNNTPCRQQSIDVMPSLHPTQQMEPTNTPCEPQVVENECNVTLESSLTQSGHRPSSLNSSFQLQSAENKSNVTTEPSKTQNYTTQCDSPLKQPPIEETRSEMPASSETRNIAKQFPLNKSHQLHSENNTFERVMTSTESENKMKSVQSSSLNTHQPESAESTFGKINAASINPNRFIASVNNFQQSELCKTGFSAEAHSSYQNDQYHDYFNTSMHDDRLLVIDLRFPDILELRTLQSKQVQPNTPEYQDQLDRFGVVPKVRVFRGSEEMLHFKQQINRQPLNNQELESGIDCTGAYITANNQNEHANPTFENVNIDEPTAKNEQAKPTARLSRQLSTQSIDNCYLQEDFQPLQYPVEEYQDYGGYEQDETNIYYNDYYNYADYGFYSQNGTAFMAQMSTTGINSNVPVGPLPAPLVKNLPREEDPTESGFESIIKCKYINTITGLPLDDEISDDSSDDNDEHCESLDSTPVPKKPKTMSLGKLLFRTRFRS